MKKIIAIIVAICLSLLAYNVYSEIEAIKSVVIEINETELNDITFSYISLKIGIKIVNEGAKGIDDLEGNFTISILNTSIGRIHFGKIDIKPCSSTNSSFYMFLYYDKIADSIIEVLKEWKFSISAKGFIKGKIFFGLISYKRNIEIVKKID